jgi:hypothetical protein
MPRACDSLASHSGSAGASAEGFAITSIKKTSLLATTEVGWAVIAASVATAAST